MANSGLETTPTFADQFNDDNVKTESKKEKTRQLMDGPGWARIKPEFLLLDFKPEVDREFLTDSDKQQLKEDEESNKKHNVETDEPPKKKKKLRGRNKNRPQNTYSKNTGRICAEILAEKECRFGDKCKFIHDIREYMASKPPDIRDNCYIFSKFGKCTYGPACRFGTSHLDSNFKNIINMEIFDPGLKTVTNVLVKELQVKLWKRKYNFGKANKILNEMGVKSKFTDIYEKNSAQDSKTTSLTSQKMLESGISKQVQVEKDEQESGILNSSNISCGNVQPLVTVSTDESAKHVLSIDESAKHVLSIDNGSPDTDVNIETTARNNCDMLQHSIPANSAEKETKIGHLESKGDNQRDTSDTFIRLRPQEKKKISFSNKLYLAPLTTVGNLPFRRICKRLGADITCGEMAVGTNLLQGQASEWALLKRHASEDIFGVQICGGYPDTLTRCGQLIQDELEVDFVDINCGCPIDLIFQRGEGSALMGRVNRLEKIVQGMTSVLDVPLTIKMRTGIMAERNIAHTVIPRLRDQGVAMVTVHGRSREQRYTRLADWDYINECAHAGSPMPVFGNGDILSFEDANLRQVQTGVSGIMIARGALIKPWIFTEIKEQRHWDISSKERFELLQEFANNGLEHWGCDTQGVENTRRFLLEWLSFLHRYIPVGLLERVPQMINERPPYYRGRDELETLMASPSCRDWIKISEMLLGPVPEGFSFLPKHKANAYKSEIRATHGHTYKAIAVSVHGLGHGHNYKALMVSVHRLEHRHNYKAVKVSVHRLGHWHTYKAIAVSVHQLEHGHNCMAVLFRILHSELEVIMRMTLPEGHC
ncbi:hypothetical protein CHS0354_003203 [Potamilus streckersoni]|uniref:tRNA-dihydrouridine(47) synthase [NAD(P)(+)] n=1 Tax=Potamilus streckersoni TaxID=2493646 RepID=A0AAE0VW24_9BIVA|nr:hypothetical protein CHS0354_003203 [Potamilus streckersoni]